MLAALRSRSPGLAAAAATAGAATLVASALPSHLHISAVPVSIVLGAVAGNVAPTAMVRRSHHSKPHPAPAHS